MKTLTQIAAELQGYDAQAMSADAVQDFLSRLVTPVQETIELPLLQALGRILAADLISPLNVPPHDNSAMDGYAFAGVQLDTTVALEFEVIGTALAGKAWQGPVQAGQCVKIMTGAIMPPGLDTVVPQELVTQHLVGNASRISIAPGLMRSGDNRRLCGEDLTQGQPALLKDERLAPAHIGLAASLGLNTLVCWRPLRVAYFSTGDEILSQSEAPREGAVYDSNRYTILAMLSRLGCELIDMGVVRDNPAHLESAFTLAASQADVVITSGGVSTGEADHTRAIMKQLGDVAFWRIAMRPGRPMAAGRITSNKVGANALSASADSYEKNSNQRTAILFGLPGNPVAVMVTFLAFVRPALLQMMGATPHPTPRLKARSSEAIRKKPGRTEYQRGWVSNAADGTLQVKTTGSQGSGVLHSMAQANGLIVLHHSQGPVAAGDEVEVMMFDGVM